MLNYWSKGTSSPAKKNVIHELTVGLMVGQTELVGAMDRIATYNLVPVTRTDLSLGRVGSPRRPSAKKPVSSIAAKEVVVSGEVGKIDNHTAWVVESQCTFKFVFHGQTFQST